MIAPFFQCMVALFIPVHRRGERIKWGVASFTMVMFSLVTIQITLSLDILSISYIDNRSFPGIKGLVAPGPLGYQVSITSDALSIASDVAFALSNRLADGLLVSSLFDVVFIHPGV